MNDVIPSFDLDAYAARYHGRGKIQRLCFIAERSPELASDALRAAIVEAKAGQDSGLYRQVVSQASIPLGEEAVLDEEWIERVDQWAARELEKLRHELEENKQHEKKEIMRRWYNNLGDFFRKRGRLQHARAEYIKTRDYCMHSSHNLEMCLKVIAVSVEACDYAHVESHFLIAENIPDIDRTGPELAKMRACAGLAVLVRGNYEQAATRFLTTNMGAQEERIATLQREFGDVMALEDVVIYGGLCAMATMDRATLSRLVVNRQDFRNMLELVPDMREIISDFYHTRYSRCLATLDKIRPELSLDIHIGRNHHVDTLYKMIRRKAIVQYVSPFVSADLCRMEKVFKTNREELINELLALIESGDIHARIDTQRHALHAKNINLRSRTLQTSMRKGRDALDDAEVMLLRMNMLKSGLEINAGASSTRPNTLGPRGQSLNSVVDSMFDGSFRS